MYNFPKKLITSFLSSFTFFHFSFSLFYRKCSLFIDDQIKISNSLEYKQKTRMIFHFLFSRKKNHGSVPIPTKASSHLWPKSKNFLLYKYWLFWSNSLESLFPSSFDIDCFPTTFSCHAQWGIFFSNFSCMFLNPNSFFSNLNSNWYNFLDMRNLQEQVKKAFCYQKLFWPFTVWINCSSDLKNFANLDH